MTNLRRVQFPNQRMPVDNVASRGMGGIDPHRPYPSRQIGRIIHVHFVAVFCKELVLVHVRVYFFHTGPIAFAVKKRHVASIGNIQQVRRHLHNARKIAGDVGAVPCEIPDVLRECGRTIRQRNKPQQEPRLRRRFPDLLPKRKVQQRQQIYRVDENHLWAVEEVNRDNAAKQNQVSPPEIEQ